MAGEIILVFAQMSTYIALKWLLEPMAPHVNRIQNIISEVNVTVTAFLWDFLVYHGLVGRVRLAIAAYYIVVEAYTRSGAAFQGYWGRGLDAARALCLTCDVLDKDRFFLT